VSFPTQLNENFLKSEYISKNKFMLNEYSVHQIITIQSFGDFIIIFRHSKGSWIVVMTVSQRLAGLSFNQGVAGSIPTLVDVSLNPEFLPVVVSTEYECNMIVSRSGYKRQLNEIESQEPLVNKSDQPD